MSMYLSIVIPAYNAEDTIVRCLDSIYRLPIEEVDFEVIVVDDASSDGTVRLVSDYRRNHRNLTLLLQSENHRQGAARNRGFRSSKGDYVVFVDSDDESDVGLLSALWQAMKVDADIAVFRIEKLSQDGAVEKVYELPYSSDEIFTGMELQTEHPFWFTGPVSYVFKRVFLDKVMYPFAEDVLFEDSDFVFVHLSHAERMTYCNERGYVIHQNPSSTTHTLSFKHVCDYALLGDRMLVFYQSLCDKHSRFADSILEGGSYNIMRSFRDVLRLSSSSEIRAFYTRFDEHADRRDLLAYRKPAYCWNTWTRFCLKHSRIVTFVIGLLIDARIPSLVKVFKSHV